MKISVNWLKEYTSINPSNDALAKKIGLQLGAVESVTDLSTRYKGIVIAKVVSVDPHVNADKLHVCLIDDGGVTKNVDRFPQDSQPAQSRGLVQVVCGAPNIATGQLVAWIPPGSLVPESAKTSEELVIDTREVRGIVSHGMLASAKELALGADASGILVIDGDVKPGTALADYLDLDDCIIDIENKMFTHRPDCFGILGIAREIAGIQNLEFKSPNWYLSRSSEVGVRSSKDAKKLSLTIKNELLEVVPRFTAVAMSNIKIEPSPTKLQTHLNSLGIRPINNVVDISNYLMLLTGQPLHIYDYDKVLACDSGAKTATLATRYPKKDETLKLLSGKTVKLAEKDILITTASKVIGLAGVMGGEDTEVSEATKNIIIESATFDMYSIRRTSMTHGIFTDAVTRFSKGQSPLQNTAVLAQAVTMVKELASGDLASPVIDNFKPKEMPAIETDAVFINQRLGLNMDDNQIAQLLKNVEFDVQLQSGRIFVKPPFWRMDIEIAEDIVEEVGRLYGYDKLPRNLPLKDLKPVAKDNMFELKRIIRDKLSAGGANELLTYSFVHGNLLAKASQDKKLAYALGNALSPDLQYYRLSMLPSLLEKIHSNVKAGYDKFALFEMGRVHIKNWLDEESLPKEESRLGFVYIDNAQPADKVSYYWALNYAAYLLNSLGVGAYLIELPKTTKLATNEQMVAPFAKERSTLIIGQKSDDLLGVVGEFNPLVTRQFKLPAFCAGFELDLDQVIKCTSNVHYESLSKYPKVEQDITLRVDANLPFYEVSKNLKDAIYKLTSDCRSIEATDIYQSEDDKKHKNITFHITVCSDEKTLKAEDINRLLDEAAKTVNQQIGAQRI